MITVKMAESKIR